MKNYHSNKTVILMISLIFLYVNVIRAESVLSDTLDSRLPAEGKHSIAIDASPIFYYVGNLFNGQSNNDLNLSSTNILYRTYLATNVVKRKRLSLSFGIAKRTISNSNELPFLLNNGHELQRSFNMSYALGKEKRFNAGNFAYYTGWEWLLGLSFSDTKRDYSYKDGSVVDQASSYNHNIERSSSNGKSNISGHFGIAGLGGIDYHFSKRFFANLELSLPITLHVSSERVDQYEQVKYNQNTKKVEITEEKKLDPRLGYSLNFNSSQYIQFRVGMVF
jgi:hypothetical protein